MRRLLLSLVVLSSTTTWAEPDPIQLDDVLPVDGATVPRNVRAHLFGADAASLALTVCDDVMAPLSRCDGTEVMLFSVSSRSWSSTFVVASDGLALPPGDAAVWAAYTPFLSDPIYEGHARRWTVVDDDDVEPPTAPTLVSVDHEFRWVGGSTGGEAHTFLVTWDPPTDDFGVAYHRVEHFVDGAFVAVGWRQHRATQQTWMHVNDNVTAVYRVVAVDVAGNESMPSTEVSAERPVVDAGAEGGAEDDDDAGAGETSVVCRCTTSSAGGGALFAVGSAGWGLSACRRRRRR